MTIYIIIRITYLYIYIYLIYIYTFLIYIYNIIYIGVVDATLLALAGLKRLGNKTSYVYNIALDVCIYMYIYIGLNRNLYILKIYIWFIYNYVNIYHTI